MSRSYKHNVVIKCAKDPWYKKHFSRKIRRSNKFQDIPNGNAYKKLNCSWDICDYACRAEFNDAKNWQWVKDEFDNEEDFKAYWSSHYRTK